MTLCLTAVYRLQFSSHFTFKKACALIPYFKKLGINGIYCSPIFQTVDTDYDITDPNKINPRIGSKEDFEEFCKELKKNQMALILDVVPNHMGFKEGKNLWMNDVLKKGRKSRYASFFDIHWEMDFEEKIVLPLLNKEYEKALEEGEFQIDLKNKQFWIKYDHFQLPLNTKSIPQFQKIENLNHPAVLDKILKKQFYRLVFWKKDSDLINYRRFFNVNHLIGLHTEKKDVLHAHHHFLFQLLKKDKIQGVRIDHPDGLKRPKKYLQAIQSKHPSILWVEKILSNQEKLPSDWPVDGTVGYEFLNILSGLFIQKKNQKQLTQIYEQFIEKRLQFEQISYERKKAFLDHMKNDIHYLVHAIPSFKKFTKEEFINGCIEIISCFPVYRTYLTPKTPIRSVEKKNIQTAVHTAQKKAPTISPSLFQSIEKLLLSKSEPFISIFQQLTAPVMAKGLEDSTFYLYNRLISLNEVGNNPEEFGHPISAFHQFNLYQLTHWTKGALPSSTHDTKMNEDARLKLHVLSEFPTEWKQLVFKWKKQNQKYKTKINEKLFPDLNTEYYLYQMLLAIWPANFKRIWTCLNKAIREAGIYTSWYEINLPFEKAVKKFLISFLKNQKQSFVQFHKKIASLGHLNSLSALVLKIGSCGIVDIYQGLEFYQCRLMDPDNRAPIDYLPRKKEKHLKFLITSKLLNFRKKYPDLFIHGEYIPLKAPDHVIAFIREYKNQTAIFIASRFCSKPKKVTTLTLPIQLKNMKNVLTNQKVEILNKKIDLNAVLKKYPFAVLVEIE